MSFSSSPLKQKFNFLTLEELEENTYKLEEGLIDKYKKSQVPEHRVVQMNNITDEIAEVRAKVEANLMTRLDAAKQITGAYLALQFKKIDFGYLPNHVDKTIGVSPQNKMDQESAKEAIELHAKHQNVKKVIEINTSALTTRTISEQLAKEVQEFDKAKLKDHTKEPNGIKHTAHIIDTLKHYNNEAIKKLTPKTYSAEKIAEMDKAIKQAKLVSKDIVVGVPEPEKTSVVGWLKSKLHLNAAPAPASKKVEEQAPQVKTGMRRG